LSGCLGLPDAEQRFDHPGEVKAPPSWQGLPVYDHIVIVVEENKDHVKLDDDKTNPFIIGNANAKFINKLRVEGASLTRMYAEEHFSQGNYFWLLSGSNQGVGFLDCVPWPGSIDAENLGHQLIAHGRSFKGYSEGLPAIGSTVIEEGDYARKHVPWIAFANIPNGTTPDTSSNLTFAEFPKRRQDFHKLPTVAFVIPNLKNDMHDDTNEKGDAVKNGDEWLAKNLGDYVEWAKTHNSLLIVTFDENAQAGLFTIGPTNPAATDDKDKNQIVTILAGARIKPGYEDKTPVTHVNLLRTIEAMYGLQRSGRQQAWAIKAGIADETVITGVFEK
jgi:acid phosphatase